MTVSLDVTVLCAHQNGWRGCRHQISSMNFTVYFTFLLEAASHAPSALCSTLGGWAAGAISNTPPLLGCHVLPEDKSRTAVLIFSLLLVWPEAEKQFV